MTGCYPIRVADISSLYRSNTSLTITSGSVDPFADIVVVQANREHRSTNKNCYPKNPGTRRVIPSGYTDLRWNPRLLGFTNSLSVIRRLVADQFQHKCAQIQSKGVNARTVQPNKRSFPVYQQTEMTCICQ